MVVRQDWLEHARDGAVHEDSVNAFFAHGTL